MWNSQRIRRNVPAALAAAVVLQHNSRKQHMYTRLNRRCGTRSAYGGIVPAALAAAVFLQHNSRKQHVYTRLQARFPVCNRKPRLNRLCGTHSAYAGMYLRL
jgi:hypothetical protein